MKPSLKSLTDNNGKNIMYLSSGNCIISIGSNSYGIFQELFDLLLNRYQINLLQSMKRSNFTFHFISEMHYLYHKISTNCGGSYIVYPDVLVIKK